MHETLGSRVGADTGAPIGAASAGRHAPRRRTGRRLLLLGTIGFATVGTLWTIATVRAGTQDTGRKHPRRSRRRRRS